MATDHDKWKRYARRFILDRFRPGMTFSGNTLWDSGLEYPEDRRLLGPLLRRMEGEGLISRVGHERSEGGHGSFIKQWKREFPTPKVLARR